jgi:hypothetical protein
VALAVAAAVALPAGAVAKPNHVDRVNAAQECRAERGDSAATHEAFREKYGTNKTKRNAFGKCVSKQARVEKRERVAERRAAARSCRSERADIGVDAFRDKYGTNRNKRNAFGKCVSQTVKAEREEQEEEQTAPTS